MTNKVSSNLKKIFNFLTPLIKELILLVLGIIIALQVNIWYENRKEIEQEVYILEEINLNLKKDSTRISGFIKEISESVKSIIKLRKYLNSNIINEDSLSKDLSNYLTIPRYFPNRSAYEILKTMGLRITNQDLRIPISEYYEYRQYRAEKSINDIERFSLNSTIPLFKRYVSDYKISRYAKVINASDPNFKKELSIALMHAEDNFSESLKGLHEFLKINDTLKTNLQNEINKLNKD